jgi:hypothetical protein
MKVNTIANPVKLPGTMLTIFLEISQFSDCHTTLNHFQCGMTKSNLQFWSVSGCFLKNNFGGNANNDNDGNPTPRLLHTCPSTSGKDAAMTLMQSPSRHLFCLCPPLLRLVGL